MTKWDHLNQCLQDLFPNKDWSFVKKYHNGAHHVHTIGWAVGGWELVSTNMFEILNKLEKKLVLHHSNRKQFEKQVLDRELRRLTADYCCWTARDSLLRPAILSVDEKRAARRGHSVEDREASGLQFPLHELVIRSPPPSEGQFIL